MAGFRRWYRRRYGRGRFYRRYRRYRRRYRKFVNGSSRSRLRVKVPVQFNVALSIPATATESNVLTVTPFFHNDTHAAGTLSEVACRGSVLDRPLFTNYAALYDSVKCDGMKVSVSITSPVGTATNAFPSLQCYTGWDRNFAYQDFGAAANYPTVNKLKNNSSFLASTALNNSITKLARSCYASDLFEKNSFCDVSTHTAGETVAGVAGQTLTWMSSGGGVTNSHQPSFSPCFMFGCEASTTDPVNARPVSLIVEVMYYMTFRNPKFGAAATRAAISGIPRSVMDDDRQIDDDGDMDDGHYRDVALPDDDDLDLQEEMVAAAAPGGLTRPTRSLGVNPKKSARVVRVADRGGKN